MERYVNEYNLCQRIKNYIKVLVGELMANEVLEKLWIHLIVDFIIKLLLITEKCAILVICDQLSKIAYFVAMIKGILAEELARLFRNNV